MPLVVEDGTGLSNADAYVSFAAVGTYASDRGLAFTGTDAEKEAAVRQATAYIDSRWRYKGVRMTAAQALEFPRTGLTDWSGYTITGVPKRVKDACSELAVKVRAGTVLFPDAERGGAVKSETVGPISVTYMDSASADTRFSVVESMLAPFVKDKSVPEGGPVFGGGTEGQFSIGMNDNPGSGVSLEE